jgi:hypothetical protein
VIWLIKACGNSALMKVPSPLAGEGNAAFGWHGWMTGRAPDPSSLLVAAMPSRLLPQGEKARLQRWRLPQQIA